MGTKPALSLTLDLSSILFGSREGAPTGGKATSKVTPTLSQAGAGTARCGMYSGPETWAQHPSTFSLLLSS